MIITILRTVIMYVFVVLALRVMGKRQIGELEPSELVVTIIISDIAATPITDLGQPLMGSLVAILLLLVLEVCLSYAAYRNLRVRTLLYGRPSTFFAKGKINQKEMERQRFNIGDLMEEVRNSGASSLDEVAYIIMETNGNVSVISDAKSRPVTPQDLNLKVQPTRISYIIIDNGTVLDYNLRHMGLDENWLKKQMEQNGVKHVKDVFYLGVDENGTVVFVPKAEQKKARKGGAHR